MKPFDQLVKPFEIARLVDAPRDRVWQAWTEPERLRHWWGPRGFKVHTCKVDLRPGGRRPSGSFSSFRSPTRGAA